MLVHPFQVGTANIAWAQQYYFLQSSWRGAGNASCICTDQSVNYKGLEERGHACGQAVRLAVGVTLGLAQLLCDPGQVVYQFLSHAAIKWQFRAPPQIQNTSLSARSIFIVNTGQRMSSIIHRLRPDGIRTPSRLTSWIPEAVMCIYNTQWGVDHKWGLQVLFQQKRNNNINSFKHSHHLPPPGQSTGPI